MRSKMRWIAGVGAALALLPPLTLAQAIQVSPSGVMTTEQPAPELRPEDQATREQLVRLFDVMRLRDQMLAMRRIVPAMMETQVREQMRLATSQLGQNSQLSTRQRAAVDQLVRKYVEEAANLYSVDEMIEDMIGLYQQNLSRDDVDAMIAFYGSTAGQHLLQAQPRIAQQYMPIVMRRATERTRTLTTEMMKDLAALKQSSPSAPPAQK